MKGTSLPEIIIGAGSCAGPPELLPLPDTSVVKSVVEIYFCDIPYPEDLCVVISELLLLLFSAAYGCSTPKLDNRTSRAIHPILNAIVADIIKVSNNDQVTSREVVDLGDFIIGLWWCDEPLFEWPFVIL